MAEYRLEKWKMVPGNRLFGLHHNDRHNGTPSTTELLKLPLDEVELEPEDIIYSVAGTKYTLGRKAPVEEERIEVNPL